MKRQEALLKAVAKKISLVGGRRDYRGDGSDDKTLAGADGQRRLLRLGGPAQGPAQ
jgi:hypothetical protein